MDNNGFFFRYDYLDENRQIGEGLVGVHAVEIQDSSQSREMAAAFDALFANSAAETKTTTEKGFIDGFAKQVGDIGSIMIAILTAVLFTILLVVANTMAQAVRERTSELAVLKTLGFSSARILVLVPCRISVHRRRRRRVGVGAGLAHRPAGRSDRRSPEHLRAAEA